MKKRIIPALLLNRGSSNICLSQSFKPWRTVGTLAQQLKLHTARQCDELLVINLDQSFSRSAGSEFFLSPRISKLVSSNVDVPIGYAGGIYTSHDASICINTCFDKVFITSAFLQSSQSLMSIAAVVGIQSVGVCLPYRTHPLTGERLIWNFQNQTFHEELTLIDLIRSASDIGVGEILLYDVDRDGSLNGFDLELVKLLSRYSLSCPVLLGGGGGKPYDFSQVLSFDCIQGCVASSIFTLTQETPLTIRSHCMSSGIPMRVV